MGNFSCILALGMERFSMVLASNNPVFFQKTLYYLTRTTFLGCQDILSSSKHRLRSELQHKESNNVELGQKSRFLPDLV